MPSIQPQTEATITLHVNIMTLLRTFSAIWALIRALKSKQTAPPSGYAVQYFDLKIPRAPSMCPQVSEAHGQRQCPHSNSALTCWTILVGYKLQRI